MTARNQLDDDDAMSHFTTDDDEEFGGDNDAGPEFQSDDDDDEDDDSDEEGGNDNNSVQSGRRLKIGPPQDTTKRGKVVPPQVVLKQAEATIHKISMGLSLEPLHPPAEMERDAQEEYARAIHLLRTGEHLPPRKKGKKKKLPMDDFDKSLGIDKRAVNPITRLAESFLGPMMRMMRVGLYLIRILFNVYTWRDPYLSFWAFLVLCAVFVFLLVFPWRMLFFLIVVLALGPQVCYNRRATLFAITSSLT
jgi:hypothetical protein